MRSTRVAVGPVRIAIEEFAIKAAGQGEGAGDISVLQLTSKSHVFCI